MNATQRNVYNELCDELTNRGIDYRKPDVFSFANNADSDATVEQLADDWIEATKASTTNGADYYPCAWCEGTGTIEDDEHGDCQCSHCDGTGEASDE